MKAVDILQSLVNWLNGGTMYVLLRWVLTIQLQGTGKCDSGVGCGMLSFAGIERVYLACGSNDLRNTYCLWMFCILMTPNCR